MKVLHVIPSVGPMRGGPSFVVRTMARELAARGIETHVATTDDNGPSRLQVPLREPVAEQGAVYWYFPRQTRFYLCSVPFARWLWWHANDYDLIHIHTLFSYCSNTAAWMARWRGIPFVIRPLGVLNHWGFENRRPLLKRLSFRLIEKRLLAKASRVHYTAEQERLEASQLDFDHTPVIIPNPVEMRSESGPKGRFRARYPQIGDSRIILFFSRIDRKKGLDLLIPAFARVLADRPNAVLVIAGDGDANLIQDLHDLAHREGIAERVIWVGFLDGDRKYEAFADAEIYVLPSYSENFGVAAVEAMSAGLPIVLTDQVAIHREVAGGHAGLIAETSVTALTQALGTLLSDARLRAELGSNAKVLSSEFSAGRVIERLIAMYQTIVRVPSAPSVEGRFVQKTL